jgi:cytochrome c heme-lyase
LKKKQPKQKSAPYSEEETRTTTTETSATVVVTNLPHHQAGTMGDDHNRWVYPSEQQLYNAMRKKGWTNVPETSIPVVLQIHNAVNEATWSRLLEYHRFGPHESRLVRFQGRPNDVTPKAWFLTRVLGYPKPFDRHDWYVEYYNKGSSSPLFPGGVRGGRWIEQRYVIDFYENDDGSPQSSTSSSSPTRVDVRPALDSPRALWLHAKRALQMSFPGITNYWYKQRRGTAGGQGAKGHPSWDGSQGSIEQEPR